MTRDVLSNQQFLPGLEDAGHVSHSPKPTSQGPATSGQWSGQLPGQLVMGVHSAEHGNPRSLLPNATHNPFEVDQHGFIHEQTYMPGAQVRVKPSADAAAGNPSARDLYRSFGGGHDKSDAIREHWDSMPLHRIRSDTPVHTAQDAVTTEHKATADKDPGRWRINKIRESLRGGSEINDPAWLVKQSGRLYAMDGHHRIVASREEGKADYPARVWDRDA